MIMINNNDSVEAYQWTAATSTWQQIGQVVDAVGSGRKQLYEGKEYDHVFDVNVSEGMPPLKLPYNITGKCSRSSNYWMLTLLREPLGRRPALPGPERAAARIR